jgi:BirA family transcriptional regulator, biotin operon repressor / biotin---[acetyl-CoA-carboxylase] ligase
MVNNIDRSGSAKQFILTFLRERDVPLSGESVSRELGISRVAVWKHIEALKSAGYPICATPKGYCIARTDDLLSPWEFEALAAPVYYEDSVGSTMDPARTLGLEGATDGTIVLAGRQETGRGRKERNWSSKEGGLYCSVILKPGELPLSYAYLVNFAAAAAVADTVECELSLPARVKWPNDVLINGKKIGGILLEVTGTASKTESIILGIGINVNNTVDKNLPDAETLARLAGKPISRKKFFSRFYSHFFSYYGKLGDETVAAWKARSETLGRRVTVRESAWVISGIAETVQRDGALLVRGENGVVVPVYTGDITVTE